MLGPVNSLGAGTFGSSASGQIILGSVIFVSGFTPLYLPYEYLSILMTTGNVNPFDIDPEQTTLITKGLTPAD